MDTMATDPALQNATVEDPACIAADIACPAFLDAYNESQKKVSFYHQFDYGHYVSWYLLAMLSLFMIVFWFRQWTEHSQNKPASPSSKAKPARVARKLRAAVRYVSYRRIPGKLSDDLGVPSAGIAILVSLFTLYCLILSFGVRPYYRRHRGYGSPPLAVRTGLMATALTPWIVALSGKANVITMLTGIGYEKLNILHRWVSRICLGLSVIHTIPFIVAPLRDGGYRALHKDFYEPGSFEYTGVPPLAMLFGLVALSIPWLRHRFYETFYFSHILLAVAYLGLMFWHTGKEGDSWTYLWVTVAVWLLSSILRAFWFNRTLNIRQSNWFQGFHAEVTPMLGKVTRIDVILPDKIKTRPGQHFFLRFPAISPFDNHPFTLAWTDFRDLSTLTFFIRSREGFTKRLLTNTEGKAQDWTNAWIEGPYGGINAKLERSYDHMILVAGGIGITGCLPWLQHVANSHLDGADRMRLSSLKLVWVIHEASHIEWADKYLQWLCKSPIAEFLTIEIHCTSLARGAEILPRSRSGGNDLNKGKLENEDLEKCDLEKGGDLSADIPAVDALRTWRPIPTRPDMDNLMGNLSKGSVVVIGCGPASLKVDLSNACARAQWRVLKGGLEQLTLHTETFGW